MLTPEIVPREFVKEIVKKEVKGEDELIDQILNTMLSAYTCNPLNLGILAPSSEGKTYPLMACANVFPRQDVMVYAGASPKSFVHDYGTLVDKTYEPLDAKAEKIATEMADLEKSDSAEAQVKLRELKKRKRELFADARTLIDFENTILVFIDAPPKELWDNLKTLLSHDAYYQEFKFVNTEKGVKTEKVVFKGWPATLFASAKDESRWEIWEEVKTRVVVTNPTMTKEKYRQVIRYVAEQFSTPWRQDNLLSEFYVRQAREILEELKRILLGLKENASKMIPDPMKRQTFWIPMGREIGELYPVDKGARQREVQQFLQYVGMSGIWNCNRRLWLIKSYGEKGEQPFITANVEDYEHAYRVFRVQGLPKFKVDFYRDVFWPCTNGGVGQVTTQMLCQKYQEAYQKKISPRNVINTYLNELIMEGYVEDLGPDPDNKRRNLYGALLVIPGKEAKGSLGMPDTIVFGAEKLKEAYFRAIKPLVESGNFRKYTGETVTFSDIQVFTNGHKSSGKAAISEEERKRTVDKRTNDLSASVEPEEKKVSDADVEELARSKDVWDPEDLMASMMDLLGSFNLTQKHIESMLQHRILAAADGKYRLTDSRDGVGAPSGEDSWLYAEFIQTKITLKNGKKQVTCKLCGAPANYPGVWKDHMEIRHAERIRKNHTVNEDSHKPA